MIDLSRFGPQAIHVTYDEAKCWQGKGVSPWRDTLSKEKLAAESQIVLGWQINTCLLFLQPPYNKFKVWTSDILDILKRTSREVTRQEIEFLIGQLNHAAFVVPYPFTSCRT
jgi:hypothetical protein